MSTTSISVRKYAEWTGRGQFRSLVASSDQLFLIGGIESASGPRSGFHAVLVSLDSRTSHENWRVAVEKSRPFAHAVSHAESLIATIPYNFPRSFTGYLEYDQHSGEQKNRCEFEEVIIGCASVGKYLYFGTGLQGVYRVFRRENGQDFELDRAADSRFQLESIRGVQGEILVITEFDRTLDELIYVHSAYAYDGQLLWKIESPYREIFVADSKVICWDSEASVLEVHDVDSARVQGVLELASPPLETPVAIDQLGIGYTCSDCTVRIRSWSGEDGVIYKRQTSGSIALAYESRRKTLFAAFSGNIREPATHVAMLQIEAE